MGWRVIAVGLVAVFGVAGCGSDVKYAGQPIDSDVGFLDRVEQQFRDDVTRGRANLGPGSHCWLLREPKTGELDSVAACGPVRHLAATEDGVWDLYRFKAVVNGHDVAVDEVTVENSGTTLPADREPFPGDGAKVPADADALAAPEPPAAKAGTVGLVPGAVLENVAKPERNLVVVPGGKVEVIEVGEVKTLPGDEQAPLYRPADGEEFRAISFRVSTDLGYKSAVDISPAFAVEVAGRKSPLRLPEADSFGSSHPAEDPQQVVVSVPKEHDASLLVSVAGVDQAISVRSGERTSTNAAAYYRANTKVAVNKQFPNRSFSRGDFEIQHQVTFTEAELTPFDPQQGWAPAGRSWLQLGFDNSTLDRTGTKGTLYVHTVNLRAGMTAVDDKGRRSLIPVVRTVDKAFYGKSMSFPVADDAKWVDLSYGPSGTFAAEMAEFDVTPRGGGWAFAPMKFRIALPR